MQTLCYHQRMEARTLEELCALARLDLTDQERSDFLLKFEGLLAFVDAVQRYASSPATHDLALVEELDLRRDIVAPFEWPVGTSHNYRVPQIIDFEEGH